VSLEHTKLFLLKKNAVEERHKNCGDEKKKELNLPIGFLRSFLNDYFALNGKQLLQSVFRLAE
jgi:hypothetical protein